MSRLLNRLNRLIIGSPLEPIYSSVGAANYPQSAQSAHDFLIGHTRAGARTHAHAHAHARLRGDRRNGEPIEPIEHNTAQLQRKESAQRVSRFEPIEPIKWRGEWQGCGWAAPTVKAAKDAYRLPLKRPEGSLTVPVGPAGRLEQLDEQRAQRPTLASTFAESSARAAASSALSASAIAPRAGRQLDGDRVERLSRPLVGARNSATSAGLGGAAPRPRPTRGLRGRSPGGNPSAPAIRPRRAPELHPAARAFLLPPPGCVGSAARNSSGCTWASPPTCDRVAALSLLRGPQ